jgi:Spy/CpxP family protein refolding chaperone
MRGNLERYTEEAMRVLQPGQRERFEQIQLHVQGARALAREDIAEKVGLTQEQRQQIREIIRENMGGRDGERPNPGEWNPQELRAQMEQRRQEIERKILQVLTAEQRAKWESMLGAPFELRPQRG